MTTAERKLRLAQLLLETEDEDTLSAIEQTLENQRKRSNKFWSIIDALDWSKEGNDQDVLQPAIQHLSRHTEEFILNFYDWLSEQLFHIDGQVYADAYKSKEESLSADLFLYARCAVVANGRDYYERVRANPALFPRQLYFEALLDLPHKAYQAKTGKDIEKAPKFIYETGFNPKGWGEQAIKL
jgi:hypothetical protein